MIQYTKKELKSPISRDNKILTLKADITSRNQLENFSIMSVPSIYRQQTNILNSTVRHIRDVFCTMCNSVADGFLSLSVSEAERAIYTSVSRSRRNEGSGSNFIPAVTELSYFCDLKYLDIAEAPRGILCRLMSKLCTLQSMSFANAVFKINSADIALILPTFEFVADVKPILLRYASLTSSSTERAIISNLTNNSLWLNGLGLFRINGYVRFMPDGTARTEVKVNHRIDSEIYFLAEINPRLMVELVAKDEAKAVKPKRAKKGYVFTVSGIEAKLTDTVKINNCYFIKDVEAFKIGTEENWAPREFLTKDDFTGLWELNHNISKNVVVGLNPKTDRILLGNTKVSGFRTVTGEPFKSIVFDHTTKSLHNCTNPAILEKLELTEIIPTGVFASTKTLKEEVILRLLRDCGEANPYRPFDHMVKRIIPVGKVEDRVRKAVEQYNIKYGTVSPSDYLAESKHYTFGVEMETSNGVVPLAVYGNQLNLKCVRDGSVPGGEYVTGVLTGDAGFAHLKKICQVLRKRCTVDKSCGVHVHIGNAKFSKDFSVYLYLLAEHIQEDVFKLFPSHRIGNRYCTPLNFRSWLPSNTYRSLELSLLNNEFYKTYMHAAYECLYKHLSLGNGLNQEFNRFSKHPGGHYAGGHGAPRYNWLNLITANFMQRNSTMTTRDIPRSIINPNGSTPSRVNVSPSLGLNTSAGWYNAATGEFFRPNTTNFRTDIDTVPPTRSRNDAANAVRKLKTNKPNFSDYFTVEFRIHSASLNYTKIRNWILICMGIVSFAENKQQMIRDALFSNKPLTLKDVISATYSEKTAKMLHNYIDKRHSLFGGKADVDDDCTLSVESNDKITQEKECV